MVGSLPGGPALSSVDAYPTDESPYGVRGLAGNVRDWCIDAWTPSGPEIDGGRLKVVEALDPSALRSIRGGAWSAPPQMCRAASRFAGHADERGAGLGFRLVR